MKTSFVARLSLALMPLSLATGGAVALSTTMVACADENAPETWVKRLDDPAQRATAIQRLSGMFPSGRARRWRSAWRCTRGHPGRPPCAGVRACAEWPAKPPRRSETVCTSESPSCRRRATRGAGYRRRSPPRPRCRQAVLHRQLHRGVGVVFEERRKRGHHHREHRDARNVEPQHAGDAAPPRPEAPPAPAQRPRPRRARARGRVAGLGGRTERGPGEERRADPLLQSLDRLALPTRSHPDAARRG